MLKRKRHKTVQKTGVEDQISDGTRLSGFRLLELTLFQDALETAQKCGHSRLQLKTLTSMSVTLLASFSLNCQECNESTYFSNSQYYEKDNELHLRLVDILGATAHDKLVKFFRENRDSETEIKQEPEAFCDPLNDSTVPITERRTSQNSAEEIPEDGCDRLKVEEDDPLRTDPLGTSELLIKDEPGILGEAEDIDMNEPRETNGQVEVNPRDFLSLSTDSNQCVPISSDSTGSKVKILNTNYKAVGPWFNVMGGTASSWPVTEPVGVSPKMFIYTTSLKYGLPPGLYTYVRNNGLHSVLVVRNHEVSAADVLKLYKTQLDTESASQTNMPPPHLSTEVPEPSTKQSDPAILEELERIKAELGYATCPKCNLSFTTLSMLLPHYTSKCNGTTEKHDFVKCNGSGCGINFKLLTDLQTHKDISHSELVQNGSDSNDIVHWKTSLIEHGHAVCAKCKVAFSNFSNLFNHHKLCNGELVNDNLYKCKDCGVKFDFKLLVAHYKNGHCGLTPLKKGISDKDKKTGYPVGKIYEVQRKTKIVKLTERLSDPEEIFDHGRKIMRPKPMMTTTKVIKDSIRRLGYAECSVCSLAYRTPHTLKKHQSNCDGTLREGDFVSCDVCGVKFKDFLQVKSHVLKWHSSKNELRKAEEKLAYDFPKTISGNYSPAANKDMDEKPVGPEKASERLVIASASRRTPLSIFSSVYSSRLQGKNLTSEEVSARVISVWMTMLNSEKEVFKQAIFDNSQEMLKNCAETDNLFSEIEKRLQTFK